jgi:hypothetical protein
MGWALRLPDMSFEKWISTWPCKPMTGEIVNQEIFANANDVS